MEYKILKGSSTELNEIAHIFDQYRVFYAAESDLQNSTEFIENRIKSNDSVIYIAVTDQNEVIGFTQLYATYSSVSMRRAWILNDLFVLPEKRNSGIGKALIHKAIEFAREDKAIRVSLSTAKDNPAQELYENIGFKESSFKFYNYSL